MGQHQHDIDELARMERLCRDLAEESRVPGEAGALLKLAENYGREATKRTVVGTVDCSRRTRKRLAISVRLTGHPFRHLIVLRCSQSFELHSKISDLGRKTVLRSSPVFSLIGPLTVALDRGFGGRFAGEQWLEG